MDKLKVVYCHFSFRRPRGKDYGIFACALYSDEEGKKLIARKTRAFELWKDHQHITAIQSYWHALDCLFEWQQKLLSYGVTNILLVTQNSTLEGWIVRDRINKDYVKWMDKANKYFSVSQKKELKIPVGICKARDYEKSRKYCREDLIENELPRKVKPNTSFRLDIKNATSLLDIVEKSDESMNSGITLVEGKDIK